MCFYFAYADFRWIAQNPYSLHEMIYGLLDQTMPYVKLSLNPLCHFSIVILLKKVNTKKISLLTLLVLYYVKNKLWMK